MYINEDKILSEAKVLVQDSQNSKQVSLEKYEKLASEYETLLSEIKFITKISDRLQNKLNNINENLLEQTVQLETAQKLIMNQNDELKLSKETLELKVAERTRELQQANNELKATNRELDTFVYRASHDIKGPIMSMLGICNLAEMEALHDTSMHYFRMLASVANQLQNKLVRLLAVNNLKKTIPAKKDFTLGDIFEHGVFASNQIKEQGHISIDIKYPKEKVINSDLSIYQILFDNLMEYAIKNVSNSDNGRFNVRMNIMVDKNLQAFFTYNGIKIPENVHSEIFNMFYRTNNNPDLTGMELYTAFLAAEKLGGKVELLSSTREETIFSILIPNVQ